MVNGPNEELIIRKLGNHHFSTIPPNHVRGIWLLWNNENAEVTILAKKTRLIHFLVVDKITTNQCVMFVVYAPAQERRKNKFWQHFKSLYNTVTFPWCLMGDFNEMLHMSEKVRVVPLTPNKSTKTQQISIIQ